MWLPVRFAPAFRPGANAAALAVVIVALGVPFVSRSHSEWDIVYVPTAAHLLAGEDIYAQPHGYTYPPFQSLLAVPVVGLPRTVQRLAWYAVNVLSLLAMLRGGWQLAGGPNLHATTAWRERLAAGLGLFAGGCFAFNALSHQQTDLLLGAFVIGGLVQLGKNRGYSAATLFGLAAAMKCTPLLFVLYLGYRGRWGAAFWMLAVAAGASWLPDAVHAPEHGTWLGRWYADYLAPMFRPEYVPGVWASEIVYNQSFTGMLNRFSSTTWLVQRGKAFVVPVEPLFDRDALKLTLAGLVAFCGTVTLGVRLFAKPHAERHRVACEGGMVVAGMLLFSPMSSPAHFGLLLVPGFLFARLALVEGRRALWLPLAVLLLGAAFANKDLWGARLYTLGLWYGSTTMAAVAALLGCWYLLATASAQLWKGTCPAAKTT